MSSDGAPVQAASEPPRRGAARPTRRPRTGERSAGQVALVLLLVLALVATVVMVFAESRLWMRLGTLAALWSAFIGAGLVARYRRQAASDASRLRDLHTVYELQLEREVSARREHELVVEKEIRESVRGETDGSVAALRREIRALRDQLTTLSGTPLADDVTALSGDRATGIAAGAQPTSVPSERVASRPGIGGVPVGDGDPLALASDHGVSRDRTPSTEQTSRITPVSAMGASSGSGSTASGRAGSGERATARPGRRPAVRPTTRPPAASGRPDRPVTTPPSGSDSSTGWAQLSASATGAAAGDPESSRSAGDGEPSRWSRDPFVDPTDAGDRWRSGEPEEFPAPAVPGDSWRPTFSGGSWEPPFPQPSGGPVPSEDPWPSVAAEDSWPPRHPAAEDRGADVRDHLMSPEPLRDHEPELPSGRHGISPAGQGREAGSAPVTPEEEPLRPPRSAPQGRHGEGSGDTVADLLARFGDESAGRAGGGRRRRAED